MIKYAKIIDPETGLCDVGIGNNSEYYRSIGMYEMEVEQSDIDNRWYVKEMCPKKSEDEKLFEAKEKKRAEALNKAYAWQENGFVEYKNARFEFSIENRNNLRDTHEALFALGETSTMWNDKDDNIIVLTLDDIQYIRLNLILGAIKKIWIEDYPKYLEMIEDAASVEEVEEIEIKYDID